jgi:hypothetical protein
LPARMRRLPGTGRWWVSDGRLAMDPCDKTEKSTNDFVRE